MYDNKSYDKYNCKIIVVCFYDQNNKNSVIAVWLDMLVLQYEVYVRHLGGILVALWYYYNQVHLIVHLVMLKHEDDLSKNYTNLAH